MKKRTTQDDAREIKQAKQFDLELTLGRSNKYLPDAKLRFKDQEFDVELKTCNANKTSGTVSTARGVNMKKINEWRKVQIWIFSKHSNNKLTGEHYVLSSKDMENFFQTCENKLKSGTKTLAGINDWQKAEKILENNIDAEVLRKLKYAFRHKGVALNDPKISWTYITQNGKKIMLYNTLHHLLHLLLYHSK